jgi:23S rRNA pseudouridine1911/1915/1917 synthase
MIQPLLNILHECDQLLVINKPAGLVCHPTKGDVYSSLISRIRLHLGPEAEAHLVNRLDRETSGVTLVARNAAVARTLRDLWERRAVEKEYQAIVRGWPAEQTMTITAPLGKDLESEVAIKDSVRPDGAAASTFIQVERKFTKAKAQFALLRVFPQSGRKHQIRIHLAHIGHPVVGDKLYGGDEQLYLDFVQGQLTLEQKDRLILPFHALRAVAVRFFLEGRQHHYQAFPEPWFSGFLEDLF